MNRAKKSLQFKFNITSVKDASGDCMIEGYANTSSKDRVGDIVLPDAFAKSLPTYQKNPVILLNHDWNDVIGRCVHQEITDKGLFIKAKISNTREDIKTLINEGCYSTFSIGYNEIDADYDDSTKTKYIKELELLEISVVSVPANTEAMFTQITEKTETASAEEKGDEEKKAKKVGDLKVFISDVKNIIGKQLDEETILATIDYFNSNEETMTKKEMIELLKVKNLPAVTATEEAKKDESAPAADPAQGADPLKELAAKLDVIAQALGQLMEKIDQMGKADASEDQAEDKPADEKPADEAAKEEPNKEEPSKEDDAKKDEEEKAKDDCDMDKEEEEKDLDLDEINKTIADLTSQISVLDEEVNG